MATKAFLRELRRKHHLGEFRVGSKKQKKTKARSFRGGTMARRRHSFRRSASRGMFGLGMWGKVALLSAGAAWAAPKVTNNQLSPQVAGALGGFLGNKNLTGAVVGYFVGPVIANVANQQLGKGSTGSSMAIAGY